MFEQDLSRLQELTTATRHGTVVAASDTTVEVTGFGEAIAVGDRVAIHARPGTIPGEVVAATPERATTMLHAAPEGIAPGDRVVRAHPPALHPTPQWLGRILDARGHPADGGPAPPAGEIAHHLRAKPPRSGLRRRMGGRVDTGLRAFNTFLPVCRGQRMGIFAGSGVGKSTLLGMLAHNLDADVVVVGLVGERGREVREFADNVLGETGMQRTVVVAETSDEAPLARRDAAYAATTIAESFRDAGHHVLLLLDSVTRFAGAQREIGLAADEPPTVRAYPPSVFSRLAGLLERTGPGSGSAGDITAIYTVLVEGDDQNEPISDNVRATLDGHVVLDRAIAERGRYPAIDVLRSVSRALPGCHDEAENALLQRARGYMATAENMMELYNIGAYRAGTNHDVDLALAANQGLERFLTQRADETTSIPGSFKQLDRILNEAEQRHDLS